MSPTGSVVGPGYAGELFARQFHVKPVIRVDVNMAEMRNSPYKNASWDFLFGKIGIKDVNSELDDRFGKLLKTLRDLTSVTTNTSSLSVRIRALKDDWIQAKDQYLRTVLHVAAMDGNTRLCQALVHSGAFVNELDGIGQTPLTLALHKGHVSTAKFLIEAGSSVCSSLFQNTIPPLEIATVKEDLFMVELITTNLSERNDIFKHVSSLFCSKESVQPMDTDFPECEQRGAEGENFSRTLNINVGD